MSSEEPQGPSVDELPYTNLRYGPHELQTIDVWEIPERTESWTPKHPANPNGYWIVFIHGGAWRDPRSLKSTARPTLAHLIQSYYIKDLKGFASIDYRLSPHPDFPQDPATTTPFKLRNARHPDHIRDVLTALELLNLTYPGFGERYILVGHSCGATLALQTLMNTNAIGIDIPATKSLPPAKGIVGVEGLYDMLGLNKRAEGGLKGSGIIEGAFGEFDHDLWRRVSPALYAGVWGGGGWDGVIILGWSPDDELVGEEEIEVMQKRLKEDKVRYVALRDVKGKHDQIRDEGLEISKLVEVMFRRFLIKKGPFNPVPNLVPE